MFIYFRSLHGVCLLYILAITRNGQIGNQHVFCPVLTLHSSQNLPRSHAACVRSDKIRESAAALYFSIIHTVLCHWGVPISMANPQTPKQLATLAGVNLAETHLHRN